MDETSIDIFGITLLEPTTVLTNLIITFICVVLSLKLRSVRSGSSSTKNWEVFFFLVSVSTLLGAITHGLHNYLDEKLFRIIWTTRNAISGLALFYGELGSIGKLAKGKYYNFGIVLIFLQLVIFIVAILAIQSFDVVKVNYGLGLGAIMIIHIVSYFRGVSESWLVAAGMFITLVSGILHSLKISANQWFNSNDIAHVFIIISLFFIYKGVFLSIEKVGIDKQDS